LSWRAQRSSWLPTSWWAAPHRISTHPCLVSLSVCVRCPCGRPHSLVPPPASTTRECGSTVSSASPSFTRRCNLVHGARAARSAAAMVWARRDTTFGYWTPSPRLARARCARLTFRNAGTLACSGGQRHGNAPSGQGSPQAAGSERQPVPRRAPRSLGWHEPAVPSALQPLLQVRIALEGAQARSSPRGAHAARM